jgi:hypothetical protein
MNTCLICIEPFDRSSHKPYSLISCPHTYCLSCLEKLNKCPECALPITGKNLNIALLSFIKESNYDKLKADILEASIEIKEDLQSLNNSRQKILTQHQNKLTCIKMTIRDETAKVITTLKENENKLTEECDIIFKNINDDLNEVIFDDSLFQIVDQDLKEKINNNFFNEVNLNNIIMKVPKLKQDLKNQSDQLKNHEDRYEFIQNEFIDENLSIAIGQIYTKLD